MQLSRLSHLPLPPDVNKILWKCKWDSPTCAPLRETLRSFTPFYIVTIYLLSAFFTDFHQSGFFICSFHKLFNSTFSTMLFPLPGESQIVSHFVPNSLEFSLLSPHPPPLKFSLKFTPKLASFCETVFFFISI